MNDIKQSNHKCGLLRILYTSSINQFDAPRQLPPVIAQDKFTPYPTLTLMPQETSVYIHIDSNGTNKHQLPTYT